MASRHSLPVYELETDLVRVLSGSSRCVVESPTGSGKSTQIPQMLLDHNLAGPGQIVVLQPRRLAARMLGRRVARERGVRLGDEVGYQVRFDCRCSDATRIVFETDGIILRRLSGDPDLSGVGAIVFDEFHERHLYGDLMLALAMRLQETRRPDLKILVMSATLESGTLSDYLGGVPVLKAAGRQFPVDIVYAPPRRSMPAWDAAAAAVTEYAPPEGDVLVFMPGAYEIRRTIEAIKRLPAARDREILPLYGDLKPEQQDAAVEPGARTKIVVSTNVAETSLTIDGVSLVIDSGLARKAGFDPRRGIGTLLIESISQASADQRAGRAGRTAPGKCVRLWAEREHASRPLQDEPEIRRVDLAETLLLIKSMGVMEFADVMWLDAPDARAADAAVRLLCELGAVDPRGGLSPMGRRMAAFPLHPRYARMLLEAGMRSCVPRVAAIAALTQERSLLLPRQNRDVRERRSEVCQCDRHGSELLGLEMAWRHVRRGNYDLDLCDSLGIRMTAARQVDRLYDQFCDVAFSQGIDVISDDGDDVAVLTCLLAAFPDHVARRLNATTMRCELVHGRRGTLDSDVELKPAGLFVASEINEIGQSAGDLDVKLSLVSCIEEDWLRELFPDDFRVRTSVVYDTVSRRVQATEEVVFRDLTVRSSRGGVPSPDAAARVLAAEVLAGRLKLKEWNHAVEQFIARVNLLAEACPDWGLPKIGEEDHRVIVEQVCLGAMGYKDIKQKPVLPVVRGWLSAAQRGVVETHAPLHVTLANGRTPKVVYEAGKPPYIALRIQELYDVCDPITIAGGRVTVLVHVLAPNQRPVQITDNLASFWRDGYPLVKKELRGRYPKHDWR